MIRAYFTIAALCLWAPRARAEPTVIHFPGAITRTVNLETARTARVTVRFTRGLLDPLTALDWLSDISRILDRAYAEYALLPQPGALTYCQMPLRSRPRFAFVLLPTFTADESTTDRLLAEHIRYGYYDPANAGPLIKALPWNQDSIQIALVHEALHVWCSHQPSQTPLQRWTEEGAADYLAFRVIGRAPQLSLTRYFANPRENALYGGSFLWWLALMQSQSLEGLHRGERADLFFGALQPDGAGEPAVAPLFPYGELPPGPRSHFTWHGPAPSIDDGTNSSH